LGDPLVTWQAWLLTVIICSGCEWWPSQNRDLQPLRHSVLWWAAPSSFEPYHAVRPHGWQRL